MIWTAEERAKLKIIKLSKKNRFMRYAMVPVMVFVTIGFALFQKLRSNTKRLTMVFGTFFVGMIYCSFSFPLFVQTVTVNESHEIVQEDVVFAEEASFSVEDEDSNYIDDEFIDLELEANLEYEDIYYFDDVLDLPSAGPKKEAVELDIDNLVFDKEDWKLVLINKQNSIPENYEVTLGTINTMKGARQCDARIIDELLQMISDAKAEGVTLAICSPYRDMKYQEKLFQRKIVKYVGKGMSYLEAFQLASQAVTIPGSSEHQIGLALDIVTNTYTSLDAGFGDTKAGIWLKDNSYKYGFILRYPLGKEYVTGIEFEPWHYRYVGVEAATVIMQNEITLEEFWEEYL